jgi:hypothetical protein
MNYPSIRIEGSILSPDIIDRLEDMQGQRPADFGFESGTRVKDEIARAWADAQDYWRIFQRKLETLKPEAPATTEARNLWVVPLLGLLKYDLEYQKSGTELNGKNYAISHRVTNRAQTPIHIVGYRDAAGLDRKRDDSARRMSAHAVVQEYLNLTEQLYGLVTNGRVLRLLRDSSRLIKQSYLEFDLDRIFTDGLFADFAILYRLLHVTRLPVTTDAAAESLIERYHQDSLDSGARIREGLSKAVEEAIKTFANGFLAHADNVSLRERIANGSLCAEEYYKSLLRLIYRLLFLMVIEERVLVFPPEATLRQRDTYIRFYSVQRLRQLAEKRYLADRRQNDLWLALLSNFRLFEAHGPGEKLGLKPLAGDLFRRDAIGDLASCQLGNDILLSCLRALSLYQHPDNKQLIRVNYAALNVEEFGSVYEGLLEYEPDIQLSVNVPVFDFRQGDKRAATGSHYTPDDLVQPLIKHSLDYLIADRLKERNPAEALLGLRVADIACGSGHILLAAARRIATELAIVKTGEEQPSPTAYRTALREVIRTCIYGVDLNPLAVELCKVALWIEAHNPGEPLNFLDHHIKCGNAIVGFVRPEDVDKGIPDEAFATLTGDDKIIAAALRKTNKAERDNWTKKQGTLDFSPEIQRHRDALLREMQAIAALPERTPDEIDAKKQRYITFTQGADAWLLKQIADIPIAQFYLPKTPENRAKLITDGDFRRYWSGERQPQGQATSEAWVVGERKRFFHWFLEFPEIIERGGFDCILGNPPYLGDKGLSRKYGHEFCTYLKMAYAPTGLSDLVVYFLCRIYNLLSTDGFMSIITTNSIRDGDVRKDGLEKLDGWGAQINMAIRGIKWPGRANLVVSLVAVHKGPWHGDRLLDGQLVEIITPFLESSLDSGRPIRLSESGSQIYNGYYWLGDGFLITHEQAKDLSCTDPRNLDILGLVINGEDMNSEPNQFPKRSAIFFKDMDESQARSYSEAFALIERNVKPFRAASNDKVFREKWWRFARTRPELRTALTPLSHCFATANTTKHLSFSRYPANWLISHPQNIFTTDRWDLFTIVQSTIHEVWARKYSGALETRLRYSPSDCFETFAFPKGLWQSSSDTLAEIGEGYHEHRRQLMLSLWLGLTDVYNLFHARDLETALKKHYTARTKKDPQGLRIPTEHRARALAFTYDEALAGIQELRRLHVALDTAVRDAYGWHDLPLGHDFHEVDTLPENDRTRYTISPTARRELLRLLLKENHARAAQEAASAPPTKVKKKHATVEEDLPGMTPEET